MKIKDLTDEQKEIFSEKFYSLVNFDDTDSPAPWGCPWDWQENLCEATTFDELFAVYYDAYKDEFEQYN